MALIGHDLSCPFTVSSIEQYKLYQLIGQNAVCWRQNSNFSNKYTKLSVLLECYCVAVWAVATIANHWRHETSVTDYLVTKFCIANNESPTHNAAKNYKILKLRATLKCVNFPPVQAVTNLTFTWQLIDTKFFEISVHSDWGTEVVLSHSFQEIVQTVHSVSAWYLLKSFSIKFTPYQPTNRHYTVCTVGSVVR